MKENTKYYYDWKLKLDKFWLRMEHLIYSFHLKKSRRDRILFFSLQLKEQSDPSHPISDILAMTKVIASAPFSSNDKKKLAGAISLPKEQR